jgi:hypothetical protein
MPRARPDLVRLVADSHVRERVSPRRGRELPIRTRALP